jgi:GT2 family glycosyltransferase/glycosyltransferase involved in cell wall biosynthesis/SAM-dependent methyltransferase
MSSLLGRYALSRTDGNFRLPRSATPLPFTGERVTGAVQGQIEFEHYHRYCFARDFCDRRDVLDLASGEGYGSALLAGVARSVVGVEIDPTAVAHAKANYAFGNVSFVQGDAHALPLADHSVDVVVSFETLEHVSDHRQFIAEVRRVLRPGGLFIVSTPDRTVYSAPGTAPNPYHVLELTEPEFSALLGDYFANSTIVAQRAVLGSLLSATGSTAWRSYERRGPESVEASSGLARATYLIGIASDAPLPQVGSSAYIDARNVDEVIRTVLDYAALQNHAAVLERQRDELTSAADRALAERNAALAAAREAKAQAFGTAGEAEALRVALRRTEDELTAARNETALAEERLAVAHETLATMRSSSSWLITAPLRGIAMRHPRLVHRTFGLVHRHPNARRQTLWAIRSAWRILTLRRPPPRPEWVGRTSGPESEPEPSADRAADVRHWFFVGDTLDWLSSHAHLTGVGKVTVSLLGAARAAGLDWRPAIAGDTATGLSAYRPGRLIGAPPAAKSVAAMLDAIPSAGEPQPGDHVLFTGVVWSPTYVALFERLRRAGVRFSVLVHDIIPIEQPEFASAEHRAGLIAWLRAAAEGADVIFVSCQDVRARLQAWCSREGLEPRRPIAVAAFGNSAPALAPSGSRLRTGVRRPFVLSVGTIDLRKNQLLLCRVWARLAAEASLALPQLVLVGRNDLGPEHWDAGIQALVEREDILLLQDVSDGELDALYRGALFTAFPSLSEGHGLPVADSLGYGKLPVVSDLPPIRDYAGDLPWYFDPANEVLACTVLRRAIEHADEREAAEARIRRGWHPRSWQGTARAVEAAMSATAPALPAAPTEPDAPDLALVQSALDMPFPRVKAIARRWCDAEAPDVSILIVNWNAARMTEACVRQLWAYTTGVTYEILIADNGSAPEDLERLGRLAELVPGVRVFPLATNRFFGEANNILAERARGRLLCLLNNDVFVSPGWLEALRAALHGNLRAGAVGPIFLFPDNTIQEAGAMVNEGGFPDRLGRGQPLETIGDITARRFDYISAAALLMSRALFLEAGGFDLAYEPAYYEDTDLCLKIAALGGEIWLCPDVTVIHLEGFSTGDAVMPSDSKRALGDLNRGKFVARWGDYLRSRNPADLERTRENFEPSILSSPARRSGPPRGRAMIFTPYMLTPGGGERYLLTLAMALGEDHDVVLVTPQPYSRLRLRNLGCEFGIDLTACRVATLSEIAGERDFDVMVAMGNHAVPPIAARARLNLFHCQFPFPVEAGDHADASFLAGYDAIIVNSGYTMRRVTRALREEGLPDLPVRIINPPVQLRQGDARAKKPMILTVGRFFVGGHVKRQDLLIEAFRELHRHHGEVSFHLAGSSMTRPEDIAYLDRLRGMAADLPVHLHVNCSAAELSALYRDAMIYWHATGLGADLARHPEHAEHFGISLVEAMSAECVPFAFRAGGPLEIITDGVDGNLYETRDELIARTMAALGPDGTAERVRIATSASSRATAFTQERFVAEVQSICRAREAVPEAAQVGASSWP